MLALIIYISVSIVALIVLFCVYLAWVIQERAEYFKKHGVPYLGICLKRNLKMFTGSLNIIQAEEEFYQEAKQFKAPIVAVSDFIGQSNLIVTDPDLIKRVMVKDFDHFVNTRPIQTQESSKYFTKMMFTMKDEQWKAIRCKMTPAFTTGKIKKMHQLFTASSLKMDKYIKKQMKYPETKSMDVDFVKLLFKYAMDVIASCAFGIDSKCWETPIDQLSTFEQHGKNFEFRLDPKNLLKFTVMLLVPKLADMLKMDIMDYESQHYFANIVKDVLKQRRESGERREDFLQLMMDIQEGTLKADEEDTKNLIFNETGDKFVFDDNYLIANALLFFSGGMDTVSTALIFSVYSLGLEPEVQEKLHEHVKSVLDKHGGKMTYDALSEMIYLDMVIFETLRLYPASTSVERICTADYIVEETGFKIEKNTMVIIPVHGIHTDSAFYENPRKFIPERFTAENKEARHPYSYLPFGHGPRSCPATRFALLKVKAMIAQLVLSYKISPCSKTQIPMKYSSSLSAKPLDGMWLNVAVREN